VGWCTLAAKPWCSFAAHRRCSFAVNRWCTSSRKLTVVSLREPDQFIELVKPAGQGEISTRGADLAGDENLHAPLAPEENADELCIAYLCKALEALKRLADRRAIPKAQVPHVDFSTFPPSHVCKEVDDYNRLIAAAQSVG
jgi:hypothetical protein